MGIKLRAFTDSYYATYNEIVSIGFSFDKSFYHTAKGIMTVLYQKAVRDLGITDEYDFGLLYFVEKSPAKLSRSGFYFSESKRKIGWVALRWSILRASPDRILQETLPHEMAHTVARLIDYDEHKANPHGKLFDEVMKFFG